MQKKIIIKKAASVGARKKSPVKRVPKRASDPVTEDMMIADVVNKHPELVEVFARWGLHCIGCFGAQFDTIAAGARVHGIHIEHLMHDLNSTVKEARGRKK